MKKFSFLLVSILSLSLVACGGKQTTPEPDPGSQIPDPLKPVTAVELSQYTSELLVGEQIVLTATVSPSDAFDKTVTWSMSKPLVVALSGVESVEPAVKVTAMGEGKVTVKAKSGAVEAKCEITVRQEDVPYEFSLEPQLVTLPAEGGEFVVTVTCTGSYHLQSSPEWIQQTSVKNNQYKFTAGANDTGEGRNDVIVFCDDVGTCLPCMVKQAAKE